MSDDDFKSAQMARGRRPSARRSGQDHITVDTGDPIVTVMAAPATSRGAPPTFEQLIAAEAALKATGIRKFAAEAAGVDEKQLNRWMKEGRDNPDALPICQEFYRRCYAAALAGKMSAMNHLKAHAVTSYRAAQIWLQAADPDTFTTRQRVDVKKNSTERHVVQTSILDVDISKLSPEDREAIKRLRQQQIVHQLPADTEEEEDG